VLVLVLVLVLAALALALAWLARQRRAVLSAEVVTRRWESGEKAHLRR